MLACTGASSVLAGHAQVRTCAFIALRLQLWQVGHCMQQAVAEGLGLCEHPLPHHHVLLVLAFQPRDACPPQARLSGVEAATAASNPGFSGKQQTLLISN